MKHYIWIACGLTWWLLLGCEEEPLGRLYPGIAVCPTEETEREDCNQSLALGELYVSLPTTFEVWVVNTGRAPLAVQRIDTTASFVEV